MKYISVVTLLLCILLLPQIMAQDYTIQTLVGSAPGYEDGTGLDARFKQPIGLAIDPSGNIIVAEHGRFAIRAIASDSSVTTVASLFTRPIGVAADNAGVIFTVGPHSVEKVDTNGILTLFAGNRSTPGSADGFRESAQFRSPNGIVVSSDKTVFIADSGNCTIRKVATTGVVTTLAGSAGVVGFLDGTGSNARFSDPRGIALDSVGNLFIADTGNFCIRKLTPTGVVTTFAGLAGNPGFVNGLGTTARFISPYHLCIDVNDIVYVADSGNHAIRKIMPNGTVSTLAGLSGFAGSQDGSVSTAQFNSPSGIALDSTGNLYIGDQNNHVIRKISPIGIVSTYAGVSASPGAVNGSPDVARYNFPTSVCRFSDGNVYVADQGNHVIRKIAPDSTTSTFAGAMGIAGSTDGASAKFNKPSGIAMDANGNVFVADYFNHVIRKITPQGNTSTLAGVAASPGATNGSALMSRFQYPYALAIDNAGNIFVADTGNHAIRKITPQGEVTTLAGLMGTMGNVDGSGEQARFNSPIGITIDSAGVLFVADLYNRTIRKITSTGQVTTLAGGANIAFGMLDGQGIQAGFYGPMGIAVDSEGALLVTDVEQIFSNTNAIRKVTSSGVVTTLTGTSAEHRDGTGKHALLSTPIGISVGSNGDWYIADARNNCIRRGSPSITDKAIIDKEYFKADINQQRQLDTDPQTATQWKWSITRKPRNSSSLLTSSVVRNPTFTPDVYDYFQIKLMASNSSGTSITYLDQWPPSEFPFFTSILPPITLLQPGQQISLSVDAFGRGLKYEWSKNGVVFPTVTGNTLQITAASAADVGYYSVVITTLSGNSAASATQAKLDAPPTALRLSNNRVDLHEPVGTPVGFFTTDHPNPFLETFNYSFVNGPGSENNADFLIAGFNLTTAVSFQEIGFRTIRVKTTDLEGHSLEQTFTLKIGGNLSAPIIQSISATPQYATPNTPIQFSVGAIDSDGDVLTYSWDFGDFTQGTGSTPIHSYLAAGFYNVRVTVSDGIYAPLAFILVTIGSGGVNEGGGGSSPYIGTGIDSDNDGFSDVSESALGTSPLDPNVTPFNGVPIESVSELQISKASFSLNFRLVEKDTITFSGVLDIPAGFVSSNKNVYILVQDVLRSFSLNSKGLAKQGNDTIKMSIKTKKGAVIAQKTNFNVSLKKSSFKDGLQNGGITLDQTAGAQEIFVSFHFFMDGKLLSVQKALSYTSKAGISGKGKL